MPNADIIPQKQRYEGASTIYGPHTHEAYLNEFSQVSEALAQVIKTSKSCFLVLNITVFHPKYLTRRGKIISQLKYTYDFIYFRESLFPKDLIHQT